MWQRRAQSRRRCGSGEPQSRCSCGSGEHTVHAVLGSADTVKCSSTEAMPKTTVKSPATRQKEKPSGRTRNPQLHSAHRMHRDACVCARVRAAAVRRGIYKMNQRPRPRYVSRKPNSWRSRCLKLTPLFVIDCGSRSPATPLENAQIQVVKMPKSLNCVKEVRPIYDSKPRPMRRLTP